MSVEGKLYAINGLTVKFNVKQRKVVIRQGGDLVLSFTRFVPPIAEMCQENPPTKLNTFCPTLP